MENIPQKINNYTAVIEEDIDGGYWAYVPSLQGCYTQGDTLDEVTSNLKEVIDLYLKSASVSLGKERKSSPFAIIQVPVFA